MSLIVRCCGWCPVGALCVVEGKETILSNLLLCAECRQVVIRYYPGWGKGEMKGNTKHTDHMIRMPLCANRSGKVFGIIGAVYCPRCLGEGRATNPGWMFEEVKK